MDDLTNKYSSSDQSEPLALERGNDHHRRPDSAPSEPWPKVDWRTGVGWRELGAELCTRNNRYSVDIPGRYIGCWKTHQVKVTVSRIECLMSVLHKRLTMAGRTNCPSGRYSQTNRRCHRCWSPTPRGRDAALQSWADEELEMTGGRGHEAPWSCSGRFDVLAAATCALAMPRAGEARTGGSASKHYAQASRDASVIRLVSRASCQPCAPGAFGPCVSPPGTFPRSGASPA